MASSKRGAKSCSSRQQLRALRERFYSVLDLGSRCYQHRKMKWVCKNIETQKHMLRSIAAFLDCVSQETANDPLVKDSLSDVVGAVLGILQQKNAMLVSEVADVVVKLVNIFTCSVVQPYVLDLVYFLSLSLVDSQPKVAISSAKALSLLISNLPKRKEKEVWEIVNESKTAAQLMSNILNVSGGVKPNGYFQELASLLATISWRWPQARYPLWSNNELMKVLGVMSVNPDPSIKVAVLKLCSALALCGYGAARILEHGELLSFMMGCMETSHPQTVQIEGFKLAQCLMMNEQEFSRVINFYCERIVKAIVCAMSGWRLQDGKVVDQIPLLVEAFHLALITNWAGEHHIYFWKMRIHNVLFDLLLPNFDGKDPPCGHFSPEECVSVARESLNANVLSVLRPYIWDTLGCLAMQCAVDFEPSNKRDKFQIDILITNACLIFKDVIQKGQQLCLDDVTATSRSEAAVRAVLKMVYSPCKYFASETRRILSEMLEPNVGEYLGCLIHTLKSASSRDALGMSDLLQVVIHLTSLICFLALPRCCGIGLTGAQTLVVFVKRRLCGSYYFRRSNFSFHLRDERTCCWIFPEGWEGRDICLFHGVWALAEVMLHSGMSNICAVQKELTDVQLVSKLQDICSDSSVSGTRWFAACILTYCGLFGFPSKFGELVGKARIDSEYVDIQLNLVDCEPLKAHGILLLVRCPSLLPSEDLFINKSISDDSSPSNYSVKLFGKLQQAITLSSRVHRPELEKLLDYVYLGYLYAEEDSRKKVKLLAQSCHLQPLTQLLSRKLPKWGTPFPTFDLTPALGPDGLRFSDLVLEAKETENAGWACTACSSSIPHMHVHRIILCSSCSHVQAMLQSGMQESHSHMLKVPISWEALVKLVHWFYSHELPKPSTGCLWENMDTTEKLQQLEPYIELSWLAEMWLLADVHEECSRILVPRIDSSGPLSVKILRIAWNYSQWELAETAGNRAAASYRQLHESGDLESLDEELVDFVRAASVRLSQQGDSQTSE